MTFDPNADVLTPISISFASAANLGLEQTTSSYVTLGYFIFPGTDQLKKTPSAIKVHTNQDGSDTGGVKIIDITNTTDIAENASVTSTAEGNIEDMGTLSNVPAGRAVFAIQGKLTTATGDTLSVYGIEMIF